MELTTYFTGLLANIEPKPTVVTTAKRSQEKLREQLENNDQISQASPDTYLSGSYARDTAINDIKDVDIIMLIDLDHNKTSPDVVIAWLQGVLQNYYSDVVAQGRSVRVTTDGGFHLDIVPATSISHRNGPAWIPDREVKTWVASHPKGQIAFAVERNTNTDGYYKHLVKIMKFWRDRLSNPDARVKSYILESLIAERILSTPTSYAHAIVHIFQGIYQQYSAYLSSAVVPKIADPGYTSVNVAKRWTIQELSAFLTMVQSSYKVSKEALDSEDQDESIQLWRKLFGSKFVPKD